MKHLVKILILFSLFSLNGCEADNGIVKALWAYSQQHPQGFTVTIPDVKPVLQGLAVAYHDTQHSHDFNSLRFVVSHALSHDHVVGGWFNEDDGKYYFDSIKLFKDNELEEAIEFAVKNGQTAIYDITNGVIIYVDDYLILSDAA